MRSPAEFPKACRTAYIIMTVAYGLTIIVAYGMLGKATSTFLPKAMQVRGRRVGEIWRGVWRRCGEISHSYTIVPNVL